MCAQARTTCEFMVYADGGQNSYFKQVAWITNFKNVAYSVATRHQKLACGYLQSQKFFSYDELQCGPCEH